MAESFIGGKINYKNSISDGIKLGKTVGLNIQIASNNFWLTDIEQ